MKSVQVIIPCYGHSAFLGEAIKSVLNSKCGGLDIQITVVCDGDNDAFLIAKEFPVETILLDKKYGTYIAQNTGISLNRSDWITFCGADDEFLPSRLSSMFDACPSLTEKTILNTWHIKIDELGMPIKLGSEALGGVFMYHKDMISQLGGFRSWICSADTDLYTRALKVGGRPFIVKQPHYRYRQHGNQLTHNSKTRIGGAIRFAYQKEIDRSSDIYIEPELGKIDQRN